MSAAQTQPASRSVPREVDLVIVGAGFAGMYLLHRARGLGMSAIVFETGTDVGGTWYWNRYPGARCDVESMQYSYSFSDDLQREWKWPELFSAQPDILRYAGHVADRFDLRRDICFETRVTAATYHAGQRRWDVSTSRGDAVSARFCVMATGSLSAARLPDIQGIDSFRGKTYHTGAWPHEKVDLSGLRVGVVGTGSSAIQAVPVIAEKAKHVTVFQRTPNFSIPSRNRVMTDDYEADWKGNYETRRAAARQTRNGVLNELNDKSAIAVPLEQRQAEYERRWRMGGTSFMAAFNDLVLNQASNDTAAEFVRSKIREIVKDQNTAELLAPKNHPIGTKRICVDTRYYETFNRDNAKLVDISAAPIEAITPQGLRTGGQDYEFDVIVFATGFDAMTGTLAKIDIRGKDGAALVEKWEAGPRTYLGLMSEGFPNMFFITGPGSPSVLSNMIVSIEQHVEWLSDCFAYLRSHQRDSIEPTRAAEDAWVEHVNEAAFKTLYPAANSWYMGANVPGKPRVFMPYIGGVATYRRECAEIAENGYTGFALTTAATPSAAAAD